jgi:hypothetical protein
VVTFITKIAPGATGWIAKTGEPAPGRDQGWLKSGFRLRGSARKSSVGDKQRSVRRRKVPRLPDCAHRVSPCSTCLMAQKGHGERMPVRGVDECQRRSAATLRIGKERGSVREDRESRVVSVSRPRARARITPPELRFLSLRRRPVLARRGGGEKRAGLERQRRQLLPPLRSTTGRRRSAWSRGTAGGDRRARADPETARSQSPVRRSGQKRAPPPLTRRSPARDPPWMTLDGRGRARIAAADPGKAPVAGSGLLPGRATRLDGKANRGKPPHARSRVPEGGSSFGKCPSSASRHRLLGRENALRTNAMRANLAGIHRKGVQWPCHVLLPCRDQQWQPTRPIERWHRARVWPSSDRAASGRPRSPGSRPRRPRRENVVSR